MISIIIIGGFFLVLLLYAIMSIINAEAKWYNEGYAAAINAYKMTHTKPNKPILDHKKLKPEYIKYYYKGFDEALKYIEEKIEKEL